MALATVQAMRTMMKGQIDDLIDDVIQQKLDDAVPSVESQGIPNTHPRFAELQRYYTAFLLFSSGLTKNETMAESVDGISINYDTNIQTTLLSSWEDIYKKKKQEVLGFVGRIA